MGKFKSKLSKRRWGKWNTIFLDFFKLILFNRIKLSYQQLDDNDFG